MSETMTPEASSARASASVGPPDTRGRPSPFSRGVFAAGVASLLIVACGVVLVQVAYAIQGGSVTPACEAVGITPFVPATETHAASGIGGARGVCNIVTA